MWGYETFAREHSAIPLYRGWTGTTFLTTSGDFLFLDEEGDAPTIRYDVDESTQLVSLAIAAEYFSTLANLLPPRLDPTATCSACGGTGKVHVRNATGPLLCGECNGVGWRGSIDRSSWLEAAESARYPTFEEAIEQFSRFARSQGHFGILKLITSLDAFFIRRVLFVRIPRQGDAVVQSRKVYLRAARRRLGVLIASAGTLRDGTLLVYVGSPIDTVDAMDRMYPDGLKLTVLTSPREIRLIGRFRWWFLSRFARNLIGTQGEHFL